MILCTTYHMIAHIQVFFWITESPVLWLDKIIEEKVALIDIENNAKIKVNQDLDESLQEFEGNQRWIYLNHCLHLLDSIKTHLIYAGYPLIKLGIIKSWMIFWIWLIIMNTFIRDINIIQFRSTNKCLGKRRHFFFISIEPIWESNYN